MVLKQICHCTVHANWAEIGKEEASEARKATEHPSDAEDSILPTTQNNNMYAMQCSTIFAIRIVPIK